MDQEENIMNKYFIRLFEFIDFNIAIYTQATFPHFVLVIDF